MEIPDVMVVFKSKGHLGKIDGSQYNSVIGERGKAGEGSGKVQTMTLRFLVVCPWPVDGPFLWMEGI